MKTLKISLLAVAAALVYACAGNNATVSGTIEGAAQKDLIVKKLASKGLEVVDTLKTDASGAFNFNLEVAKGDPDFVYIYYGAVPAAALILQSGDKVKVVADTLGASCSVEGSAESVRLQEALALQRSLAAAISSDGKNAAREYIGHYRRYIRFVMDNSKSLAVIPLLSEKLPSGTPVFSQVTDAIHYKNTCDSLKTVYPESRYVKALEAEATARMQELRLSSAMEAAREVGYIDIELPDENGRKVKLSEVSGKVVMVFFWSSVMGEQKLFNQDVLKPVYRDYHKRGFEIYAVSLDSDKASWATAVKTQNAGWINVCDSRGTSSPVAAVYNVQKIPSLFFIVDGNLVTSTGVKDEDTLRRFLSKRL